MHCDTYLPSSSFLSPVSNTKMFWFCSEFSLEKSEFRHGIISELKFKMTRVIWSNILLFIMCLFFEEVRRDQEQTFIWGERELGVRVRK